MAFVAVGVRGIFLRDVPQKHVRHGRESGFFATVARLERLIWPTSLVVLVNFSTSTTVERGSRSLLHNMFEKDMPDLLQNALEAASS